MPPAELYAGKIHPLTAAERESHTTPFPPPLQSQNLTHSHNIIQKVHEVLAFEEGFKKRGALDYSLQPPENWPLPIWAYSIGPLIMMEFNPLLTQAIIYQRLLM